MVKKTPAYKNRLRALELERSGGVTNKKKNQKQMDKYAISCFGLENSFLIGYLLVLTKKNKIGYLLVNFACGPEFSDLMTNVD